MTKHKVIDLITEQITRAEQMQDGLRRIANNYLPSSASPRRVNQKVSPQ